MGTVANTIQEWAAGDPEKEELYSTQPGLMVRWINEAQLRFADRSECLRGVWQPTITSSGNIALPADFIQEFDDKVKWSSTVYLKKIDYPTANLVTSFMTTQYYSVWNGYFYVWAIASGTPDVPYIKKPTAITTTNIATAALDIPTEFHRELQGYFDSAWLKRKGDLKGFVFFEDRFDQRAIQAGMEFRERNDPVPMMRGSFF